MQYRVLDRKTLAYVDGGYIPEYSIDNDYIVNNNSIFRIVQPTAANAGDIFAAIENSGAYLKGIVTAVDNEARQISVKSGTELFNDNMYNPMASAFTDDSVEVAGKFGLETVAALLETLYVNSSDPEKNLPLVVETAGDVLDDSGSPCILWNWSDNQINLTDWLIELFEKYLVRLTFDIDFNISELQLRNRQPKIIVQLSAGETDIGIIKDNSAMQTFTYTKEELPDKTVCIVIDSESKAVLQSYYLYDVFEGQEYLGQAIEAMPDLSEVDGKRYERVLPVKTCVSELNSSDTDITERDVARDELISGNYNHIVQIDIAKDSKMFDWERFDVGDKFRIVTNQAIYEESGQAGTITIDSVLTGRKETSSSNMITLYFGLGRKNYTDLMQIRLRKQRYSKIYNAR